MRKIISLVCAAILLVSMGIPAFAVENFDKLQKFRQIPIYITTFDPNNSLTQADKDSISDKISSHRSDSKADLNTTNMYTITRLTDTQIKDIVSSPIYTSTLNRFEELIDSGTTVKSINFYVPYSTDFITQSSAQTRSGNADDPAYWEANLSLFGTYQTYKFLYMEASAQVETPQVELHVNWHQQNWATIAQNSLWATFDQFVQNVYYRTARSIFSIVSSLIDPNNVPLSVVYGPSHNYIKGQVSGDLYVRTLLIRDDIDRIPGYAYYPWANMEQLIAALRLDAKYAYQYRTADTYNYKYPSFTTAEQSSNTPGFHGSTILYDQVIDLYHQTGAYVTHSERIDVSSLVLLLLG